MATTSKENGTLDTAEISAQIETLKTDLGSLTSTLAGYVETKGKSARDGAGQNS